MPNEIAISLSEMWELLDGNEVYPAAHVWQLGAGHLTRRTQGSARVLTCIFGGAWIKVRGVGELLPANGHYPAGGTKVPHEPEDSCPDP